MKIIDLSHTIRCTMPVYPGTELPAIVQASTITDDGFAEKRISLHSHTGTHIDAPAHILPGRATLDTLSCDHFVGMATCLAIDQSPNQLDILKDHERSIASSQFLLLATSWSDYWGREQYFHDYPVLSEDSAEYICRFSLKGIGLDTLSADREHSKNLPIHRKLLQHMIIIENLTNLTDLVGKRFLFSCLPLKIEEADGSPVRAAAMFLKDEL